MNSFLPNLPLVMVLITETESKLAQGPLLSETKDIGAQSLQRCDSLKTKKVK